MSLRISSWYQVLACSVAMTATSVFASVGVVAAVWWNTPFQHNLRLFEMAAFIPLFIAAPTSFFALYIIKALHDTVSRMDKLVKYDAMTGALVRTQFLELAEQGRKDGGYLLLADADHFKSINDSHGHGVGDAALTYLVATMVQVLGPYGYVGRMGGEEFAARLPNLSRAQVELLLQTLGTRLRNEGFEARGVHLKPTLSVGVVADDGRLPVSNLLWIADKALYEAKARGRDRFVFAEVLDGKGSAAA